MRTEVKWCQSPSTVYRAQDEWNGNGEVKNSAWWRDNQTATIAQKQSNSNQNLIPNDP